MGEAGTVLISLTVILGVLAIVAVGLRCYCRIYQRSSLGPDDYCMIISLVLSTGISIASDYTASVTGFGELDYVPTMDAVIFALKATFAIENCQIAAMGFVKVSVLLYYKRIFVSRPFVIANYVLVALVSTFTLAVLLVIIFSKWPVYEQWNPLVPYNINVSGILITYVAGNAMLDIATLALPITALRNLQMTAHRRLLLSTIFTLGSTCVIASLIRLYYAVEYIKVPATPASLFMPPFIYNILWAIIECPIFIITGSLITLGPLFRSKYGPASLFKSIRSHLLPSNRTAPSAEDTLDLTHDRNPAFDHSKHKWRILSPRKDGNHTHRGQLELSQVSSNDHESSQRSYSAV